MWSPSNNHTVGLAVTPTLQLPKLFIETSHYSAPTVWSSRLFNHFHNFSFFDLIGNFNSVVSSFSLPIIPPLFSSFCFQLRLHIPLSQSLSSKPEILCQHHNGLNHSGHFHLGQWALLKESTQPDWNGTIIEFVYQDKLCVNLKLYLPIQLIVFIFTVTISDLSIPPRLPASSASPQSAEIQKSFTSYRK